MNWLSIAVICLIVFYTWRGYHNGLIKTVFFILSFFVAIILASIISPIVSRQLQQNEFMFNGIKNVVQSGFNTDNMIKSDSIAEEIKSINELPLPDELKQILTVNNNSEIYKTMKATNFSDYISSSITTMVINAISYLLVFIVVRLLIRLLAGVLNLIANLPVLHTINKAGGVIVGFIHSVFIVWILAIVLMVFAGTETGKQLYAYIEQSTLLSWIYNNNLILNLINDTFQGLISGIR